MTSSQQQTVLGQITALYGVKGWVKIYSYTEPMENILSYSPWLVLLDGVWSPIEVVQGKRHGKGIVAKLAGCDDRDQARRYCGADIAVESGKLPQLESGDYYWSQLETLKVVTELGVTLGRVDHMMATGSNDVLVVKSTEDSLDDRERLVPYLPDQVVKDVNLDTGIIRVDWDPEF